MAFPMGWENYFGFVCTPRHATYHNIRREGAFTLSYPRPRRAWRHHRGRMTVRSQCCTPSRPSRRARLIESLSRTCATAHVDHFGENSLIAREGYLRTSDGDVNDLIHESKLLACLNPGRYARVENSNTFPAGLMR